MKTIRVNFIDTGGHGYYSVSKPDFLLVCTPEQITGCSGHSLTRIYLEEDCDATTFFDAAKAKGIEVSVKSSYNLKFNITHNFNPELFDWKPEIGKKVKLHDDGFYTIVVVAQSHIVVNCYGTRYRISLRNPFQYIIGKEEEQPVDKATVLKWATERISELIIEANSAGVSAMQARAKYNKILTLSPEEFYTEALRSYRTHPVLQG